MWEEISIAGVPVETRFLHRFGPGPDDFVFAAYLWRADQSGADLADLFGVQDANGTGHDVPSVAQCASCHGKLSERVLGFGAVQLSHSLPGETLTSLSQAGRLTVAPPPAGFGIPGGEPAVGYLHGNCGHCHNDTGVAVSLRLRALTTASAPGELGAVATTVGKKPAFFAVTGVTALVEPGAPDASAVWYRLSRRNDPAMPWVQMPPLDTALTDPGAEVVREWILSLGGAGGSSGSSGAGGASGAGGGAGAGGAAAGGGGSAGAGG